MADTARRLDELRALPDGWLDGHGLGPKAVAVDAASALLSLDPGLAMHAVLTPDEDGGVLIEYVRDGWDIAIEAAATGDLGMFAIPLQGGGGIEPTPLPREPSAALAAVKAMTASLPA